MDYSRVRNAIYKNIYKNISKPRLIEDYKMGFEDGVKWVLDNIWKSNKEVPGEGFDDSSGVGLGCLVQFKNGIIKNCYAHRLNGKYYFVLTGIDGVVLDMDMDSVVKWCYIKDFKLWDR